MPWLFMSSLPSGSPASLTLNKDKGVINIAVVGVNTRGLHTTLTCQLTMEGEDRREKEGLTGASLD